MELITPLLSGEFLYFCSYFKYQLSLPTLTFHVSTLSPETGKSVTACM